MRKLVVHQFVTADGVIQGPGGADEDRDGGFDQGGWVLKNWHDAIGPQIDSWVKGADALVLGRKTWQSHAGAFEPHPDQDPFAGMKKYVVSRSLTSADAWRDSELLRGDLVEAVRSLKAQPGKDLALDGSVSVLHRLLEAGLVDELSLHVFPVSVGGGKRLFPEGTSASLRLLECETLPNGVIFVRYAVGSSQA